MNTDANQKEQRTVLVWDRGVRIFHWLLVASVALAAWTGFFGAKTAFDLHLIAGAVITALVLHRLVWGFLGSTHARFRNFVTSPIAAIRHALEVLRGRAPAELGHNPLGAMMIVSMLLVLSGLVVTGLIAWGGIFKEGPLSPITPFAFGAVSREIHEVIANVLIALIALHVAGVIAESLRTRENLIGSMVHGTKRQRAEAHSAASKTARPWPAALATTTLVTSVAAITAIYSSQPGLGVPTAALDKTYLRECGSCHSPHHPSLAPAAVWAKLMTNLGDHFGDNAELAPDVASLLTVYLAANAGDRWDTQAANLMRRRSVSDPLRITATQGWLKLHEYVPESAFKAKPVASKVNCTQCHADAETGRFLPRHIRLPAAEAALSTPPEKTP